MPANKAGAPKIRVVPSHRTFVSSLTMERREDLTIHEYPDPSYAAYANRYPWVGEDDGYMPSGLRTQRQSSWRDNSPHSDKSDQSEARSPRYQDSAEDLRPFRGEMTFDSDYRASDANVT